MVLSIRTKEPKFTTLNMGFSMIFRLAAKLKGLVDQYEMREQVWKTSYKKTYSIFSQIIVHIINFKVS